MTQSPSPVSPGRHLPVLDGIRGLAIALVMLQHFFHGITKGPSIADDVMFGLAERSWMGVDLFFVLSGFLITGILWDAKEKPGYFKNFYARRVLRIFPAYYVVLLIFLVVLPLVTDSPHEFGGPSGAAVADQAWHWTYLTNFRIAWNEVWYANHIPNVFWSLAIEEQFYLVWPIVVLACGRRTLMVLCGALFTLALVVRLVLAFHPEVNWISSFVLTPARMDGLVLGAMLALVFRSNIDVPRSRLIAFSTVVVCLIPFALLSMHRPEGFRELPIQATRFTVIALLFAALLWLGVTGPAGRGIIGRVFCNGFMGMLGKYSYALYLWHGPVSEALRVQYHPDNHALLFGSRLPHTLLFALAASGISLLLAWLSWNLVERHCLRLKDRFAAKPTSASAAAPASAAADVARQAAAAARDESDRRDRQTRA